MRKVFAFGLTFSLAGAALYACSDSTEVSEPTPEVDAATQDAKSSSLIDVFVPDARGTGNDASTDAGTKDSGPKADSGADGGDAASDSGVVLPPGAGNFTVVRVGAAGGTLSSAAQAVFIEERQLSDGTVAKTTPLPTAVAGAQAPLTLRGGTGTAEGALALSSDSAYLVLGGYSSTPGTAAPADVPAATAPRVVGRIDKDGNVDTSTVLGDAYDAGAIRGVASVDGTAFWLGGTVPTTGTNGGVYYATLGGATVTQLFGTVGNLRGIGIFGAQVYATTQSSTDYHVFSVGTGLPTTAGQTATALPGYGVTYEPGSIVMLDTDATPGVDTMYAAETETASAGAAARGVQKWKLAAGTWTLAATFQSGLTATGAGPLFVNAKQVGTEIIVLATTPEATARVIRYVDDGVNPAPTGVTIASGTNGVTSFRGVAFPAK